MTEPDPGTWELAASGDLGDLVHWESSYRVMGHARDLLSLLDSVGRASVDWDTLLAGLPCLQVLRALNFPPLYVETSFEEIHGFLTIVDEPMHDELPGRSFSTIRVYVDREKGAALRDEFRLLVERLEAYPPIERQLGR